MLPSIRNYLFGPKGIQNKKERERKRETELDLTFRLQFLVGFRLPYLLLITLDLNLSYSNPHSLVIIL
jgi:hypothetical protein